MLLWRCMRQATGQDDTGAPSRIGETNQQFLPPIAKHIHSEDLLVLN